MGLVCSPTAGWLSVAWELARRHPKSPSQERAGAATQPLLAGCVFRHSLARWGDEDEEEAEEEEEEEEQ
eukprot:3662931-Pyramimonas_sp.AAC.2